MCFICSQCSSLRLTLFLTCYDKVTYFTVNFTECFTQFMWISFESVSVNYRFTKFSLKFGGHRYPAQITNNSTCIPTSAGQHQGRKIVSLWEMVVRKRGSKGTIVSLWEVVVRKRDSKGTIVSLWEVVVRKGGSKGTIVALWEVVVRKRGSKGSIVQIKVFTQRSQPNKVPVPANSPWTFVILFAPKCYRCLRRI